MMARRYTPSRLLPALAAFSVALWAAPAHASTNLLNVYLGAAVGHASLRGQDARMIPVDSLGSFDRTNTAYQVMAGVRGLYLLGAELDYFNLGHGTASPILGGPGTLTNAQISQRGEAAFAVLYLPVPVIDVYLKAGVARLTTRLSAAVSYANCSPAGVCLGFAPFAGSLSFTETGFAAGAGLQWKLGNWAVRAEYERFAALGEHPDLETLGVTWSIL